MFKLSTIAAVARVASTSVSGGELDASKFSRIVVLPSVGGDYNAAVGLIWDAFALVEPASNRIDFAVFKDRLENAASTSGSKGSLLSTVSDIGLVQMGNFLTDGYVGKLNEQLPGMEKMYSLLQAVRDVLGWQVWSLFGRTEMDLLVRGDGVCKPSTALYEQCDLFNRVKINSFALLRLGTGPVSSGSTLFLPGDLDLAWFRSQLPWMHSRGSKVERFNEAVRKQLVDGKTSKLTAGTKSVFHSTHTRDLSHNTLCATYLPKMLKEFNVARIIVQGHQQRNLNVNAFCGGRLVFADPHDAACAMVLAVDSLGGLVSFKSVCHTLPADSLGSRRVQVEDIVLPEFVAEVAAGQKEEGFGSTVMRMIGLHKPAVSRQSAGGEIVGGKVVEGPLICGSKTDFDLQVRDGVVGVLVDIPTGNDTNVGQVVDRDLIKLVAEALNLRYQIDPEGSSVFVEARCDVMLSEEVDRTTNKAGLIDGIKPAILSIVGKIDALGIDIGRQTTDELLDSFCVTSDGGVALVDLTGLTRSLPISAATHMKLQVETMKKFLKKIRNDNGGF